MSDRPGGGSTGDGSPGDGSPGDGSGGGEPAGDSGEGSSRLGALVSTTPRKVAVVVLALVAVVVAAYLLGVIGVPSAGLVDRGDWGNVTEERTEVVTTVWIRNTNPFPIALGDGLSARYEVAFNDVALAAGEKDAIRVPKGNSTLGLRTYIRNDRLPAWWVAFVEANETIAMDINGTLTVDVGPAVSHDIHQEQTALEDSTPIITALSTAANGTTGRYTRTVGADSVDDGPGLPTDGDGDVTVGYEIREGSARWAGVSESETTVLFAFRVHNPGDVPVPAVPDGIGVGVDMNDVRLFEGDSGSLSPRSVGPDAVIAPGETRTVTFTVRMDNDRIDEWFTSHVRRGERTAVSTSFQLVFDVPITGSTIRVPRDSPASYDCQLRTAILVDNATTETNCGDPGSPSEGRSPTATNGTGGLVTTTGPVPSPSLSPSPAGVLTTALSTPATPPGGGTETLIPTGTSPSAPATLATTADGTTTAPSQAPTARVTANTTSGSAPLTVAFDGSDSTDPDGDIARYVWTFDDLSTPAEGPTVTHTFDSPGSYDVTLTVVDDTGREDSATVTVDVSAT